MFEFYAISCAFLWAISSFIVRTQSTTMTPAVMNAIRCAAAGVVFWVLLPFNASVADFAALSALLAALLIGSIVVNIVLGDTFSLVSIRAIGLSRSMPLAGTFPGTTMIFEYLLLGEAAGADLIVGAGLIVVGTYFLSRSRAGAEDSGDLTSRQLRVGVGFALAASVMWGLGTVLLKPVLEEVSLLVTNAIRMPAAVALLILLRIIPSERRLLRRITWRNIAYLVASGLIGMALGSYLFLAALQELEASRVVTLLAISPLFGMLLSVLFLKEKVGLDVVAGMVLCFAGVVVVS